MDHIFTQYVHGIHLFSCIDVFNWTITYRDDSDIWRPYGWLDPMAANQEQYFVCGNERERSPRGNPASWKFVKS